MRRSSRRSAASRRLALSRDFASRVIASRGDIASRVLASPLFDPRRFATRRSGRRFGPFGWFALGAGLAGLGFTLLDPSRGAARRAMLREKTSTGVRRLRDGTRGRLSDARARAQGALQSFRARLGDGEVADSILEERVRAQIGRAVSHPGALRVSAAHGRVEISGPVLAGEADDLIDSVRSVRGVRDVVDRLDLHDFAGSDASLQGEGRRPSL